MNICFLCGSGISVPAGFPSVGEITQNIFSDFHQPRSPLVNHDGLCDSAKLLMRWLEIQIKRRYPSEGDKEVHYENLYFLAKQLQDDLLGEYENPALLPFIESAIEQVLPHSCRLPGSAYEELRHLVEKILSHINQCIVALLEKEPSRFDHLDFLGEALQEIGNPLPALLTLNHDTLLEKYLDQKNLEFTDGFEKTPDSLGIRKWQSGVFLNQTNSILLLKLHGGINWNRFSPHESQTHEEDYFGIPTPRRMRDNQDAFPIALVGTWDKLLRYTDPIYLEIYHAAYESIRKANLLVIIGYGFGDKGINKLIIDWMCRSSTHRLIVIDIIANSLQERARVAIANKWDRWLNENRLFPKQVDLEKTKLSWPQIKQEYILT